MWSFTRGRFRRLLTVTGVLTVLLLAGCSGPDQFGINPLTPVVVVTATATSVPIPEPQPSPTASPTVTPEPTPEPSPTPEVERTPSPSPEPTDEPEPTAAASEEADAATATPSQVDAMDALPRLEELNPEAGYVVADQGERTADQLAQAYMDSNAHLARLEEWGFVQHVFREFTRGESGPEDTLPTYVLATVNVYGSPEQADMAMQWIERSQISQGSIVVDAPDVGDAAIALTHRTSQGEDAAWVVYRYGSRVYIYYAQGNQPLDEVFTVAERVFERIANPGEIASQGWPTAA